MPSPKTQPARGMRDFLPADVRKREYVIGVIKQVYERYGFEPLETPAVENIETLMGKYGEEGNQLIFKILKRGEHEKTGEADLALRYDLTVPLARVVAQYQNDLPKFFKRYQIQPVWRADRPARGRFREFYQCDVDVLGSQSMVVEAELISAASDALVALGFKDFYIRLNHRAALTGVLDAADVPPDKQDSAVVALDKLDKIGRDGVRGELSKRGIPEIAVDQLMAFLDRTASLEFSIRLMNGDSVESHVKALNNAILGQLVEFVGDHEIGAKGIDELRQILQFADANQTAARIRLVPSLARGLSYYTGATMEINVPDLSGSLGGGGRYDNLIGTFLGRTVWACGFSLGLERIIVVMTERNMFPAKIDSAAADILVTIWEEESGESEESITFAITLARELRTKGLRVDLDLEPRQGGWYKYTKDRGIRFFTVARQQEREQNQVRLVDMLAEHREDQAVPRDQVARVVLQKLRQQPVGEADDSIKPGA